MKKIFCLVLCSLFLLAGCGNSSYFELTQKEIESTGSDDSKEYTSTDIIFIQVAGSVCRPGVYQLTEDSRVFQAIEAAGGLTEDADDSAINQAQKLTDGQKLYIYSKAETIKLQQENEATNSDSDGRLNINTASVSDLCSLPGIGESKANLIVSYRQANGSFSSIEDIKNVSGIGDGIYKQIQELIITE